MSLAVLLLISYLVGAVPTSVIMGRVLRGIDVRSCGSKNAGATNAWRVLGWKVGVAVLALDLGKGLIATMVVSTIPLGVLPVGRDVAAILCGLLAVLGHVFPVYIGFRGGKGVATGAGMLLGVAPLPFGIAVSLFLVVALVSGFVSLASLLGALSVPIAVSLLDFLSSADYHPLLHGVSWALFLFIVFTHRSNIGRLLHRKERAFDWVTIIRRVARR